ncbi:mycothiol synthase [Jongsikchunia kroppenstedtii]|uniref:mycothiol synthase n=1 Tax=Jongsikchunia kroppenstedtii TaxID=1121721 RepID=UPI0003641373|nr:mycothiol synthase [Jongsikchunia kroppenstedtii]
MATLSDRQRVDVHSMLAAATALDGVAPLGEQSVLLVDRDGEHVWTEIAGRVVGYANVTPGRDDEPPMAEVVVDPDFRGRGIGTVLAGQLLETFPGVRIWAHGDLPAAAALGRRLGLRRTRELLQLRRDLTGLPELSVPADLRLRTYAGPAEDAELLRVNNAAFEWHPEQGGWTQAQIDERTGADWFDPAGVFLAFDAADDQRLLGFHWTKIHRADDLGEVYVVGVDPAAQGRGIGHVVTLAGLRYLADQGLPAVQLYVEGDNTAALKTYERLGFTRYAVDVAYGAAADSAASA